MNQLQAMRVFLHVAESGSFGSAAQQMNLSNAVITRYVALLEEHLGARLLNRTTRRFSLTDVGAEYSANCRQIIDQLDSLDANISTLKTNPAGHLRIASAASFSLLRMTPLIGKYRKLYPDVRITVDLFDKPVSLIEEGDDLGVLMPFQVSNTSVVSRPILSVTSILVGTSELLRQAGNPVVPEALVDAPHLMLQVEARHPLLRIQRDDETREISLKPVYAANNLLMIKEAAVAGLGFAVLPRTIVSDDLHEGRLIHVLPEWEISDRPVEIALIYPGRRNVSAKTRAFIDLALDHFTGTRDLIERR
jgi:DNA-binding transcriptional LysR family regulator